MSIAVSKIIGFDKSERKMQNGAENVKKIPADVSRTASRTYRLHAVLLRNLQIRV